MSQIVYAITEPHYLQNNVMVKPDAAERSLPDFLVFDCGTEFCIW